MRNLIIVVALITLFSCKKNEDYKKDEWKTKGVNFSVYSPDSTTFVQGGGVEFIKIFRDEQHFKDHKANFSVLDGRIVDKYPPLYASGYPTGKSANPLDIVGVPSGTYFVVVEPNGKFHFTNKYLTYNADVSQGYTFFKLYLEKGIYLNGQLTF